MYRFRRAILVGKFTAVCYILLPISTVYEAVVSRASSARRYPYIAFHKDGTCFSGFCTFDAAKDSSTIFNFSLFSMGDTTAP